MKKHPVRHYYFFSAFFLCIQLVLGLPGVSGAAGAMPCGYRYLFYGQREKDAFGAAGPCGNNSHGGRFQATSDAMPNVAPRQPVVHADKRFRSVWRRAGLLNLGVRGVYSSDDVIGADAPERFRAYDVTATFRLPWGWYTTAGWGGGMRWMAGAGVLTGGSETGPVVSLTPLLALGSRDGRFTVDMGAGAALFGRTTFKTQDFGGHFQFTLTAGAGFPLYMRFGAGYRFVHYSDAALHGEHTIGADLHMLEITYRF